jgi:hypothetical protein
MPRRRTGTPDEMKFGGELHVPPAQSPWKEATKMVAGLFEETQHGQSWRFKRPSLHLGHTVILNQKDYYRLNVCWV